MTLPTPMSNFSVGDWVVIIQSDSFDAIYGTHAGVVGKIEEEKHLVLFGIRATNGPDSKWHTGLHWVIDGQMKHIPKVIAEQGEEAVRLHVALAHSIVI